MLHQHAAPHQPSFQNPPHPALLRSVEPGEVPTLQRLGFSPAAATPGAGAGAAAAGSGLGAPLQLGGGSALVLRGGESEALRHMQSFIDEVGPGKWRVVQLLCGAW